MHPFPGPSATLFAKQPQGDEMTGHWVTVVDKKAISFEVKACLQAEIMLSSSVGTTWPKTYHITLEDSNHK